MSNRLSAFLILPFVAAIQPLRALAQPTQQPGIPSAPYDWPGPWHMWGGGYGWPFWWVCVLVMLVFVVCVAMFFFRRSCPPGLRPNDPHRSALQILSERFAKGEIGKDEYEEKKSTILAGGGVR